MTEAFSNRPTTVADYLVIFRRRKWIVLLPPIVAALAAFALSTGQSPLYRASAEVLVNPRSVVTAITGVDPSGGDPNRFLQTQASIARSPELAARVAAASGIPGMTAGRVLSESQVTPSTDSDIVGISVEDARPGRCGTPRQHLCGAVHSVQQGAGYGLHRRGPGLAANEDQVSRRPRPSRLASLRNAHSAARSARDRRKADGGRFERASTCGGRGEDTPSTEAGCNPRLPVRRRRRAGACLPRRGARSSGAQRARDRRSSRASAARPHTSASARASEDERPRHAPGVVGRSGRDVSQAADEHRIRQSRWSR